MNKYTVSIDIVRDYEARDEDEALAMFYEELATANESIENFIEIKPIMIYENNDEK